MTPKSSQNQKSELKELQKIKVAQLHEQSPKHFLKSNIGYPLIMDSDTNMLKMDFRLQNTGVHTVTL